MSDNKETVTEEVLEANTEETTDAATQPEEPFKRQFLLKEDFEYIENTVGYGSKVGIGPLLEGDALKMRILVNHPDTGETLYVENAVTSKVVADNGFDIIVQTFATEAKKSFENLVASEKKEEESGEVDTKEVETSEKTEA